MTTPTLTGASHENRKGTLVLYFDRDVTPADIHRIYQAAKASEGVAEPTCTCGPTFGFNEGHAQSCALRRP